MLYKTYYIKMLYKTLFNTKYKLTNKNFHYQNELKTTYKNYQKERN